MTSHSGTEDASTHPRPRRSVGALTRRFIQLVRERRPPDRLESYLYEQSWYRNFWNVTSLRGILRTPPSTCNPLAHGEVHSLVCHRDLYQYLGCVKSFLRFNSDVCVIAHDDGSLTARDRGLLSQHIPGIVVVPRVIADQIVEARLADFPACLAFRRNHFIARQLFDYALLSRSGRIVSLDSDTLFLSNPTAFTAWLRSTNPEGLYSYEDENHNPNAHFGIDVDPYAYHPHICAGLMCYDGRLIDLPFIEGLLSRVKRFDWVTSQMAYLILAQRAERDVRFFDSSYQTYRFQPGAAFRHYWGHNGLSAMYRMDMRQVINELRNGSRGEG